MHGSLRISAWNLVSRSRLGFGWAGIYNFIMTDEEKKKQEFKERWESNLGDRKKFESGFKGPDVKGAFSEMLSKFGFGDKKKKVDPSTR